jgi:hypothetical protein
MARHRLRYRGPLLAAPVLLLAGSPADAALFETSVVHGTVCQARNIGGEDAYYNSNGIYNNSRDFDLQVFCPIPHNMPTSSSQSTKLAAGGPTCTSDLSKLAWVEVYDRNSTTGVACTLFVMLAGGAPEATFSIESSGSSMAPKRLTFTTNAFPLATGRYLVVRCDIPRKESDFSFVANIGMPMCQVTP